MVFPAAVILGLLALPGAVSKHVHDVRQASLPVPSRLIIKQPLAFEPNRGQYDSITNPDAAFFLRGKNYNLILTPTETKQSLHSTNRKPIDLKMKLIGANKNLVIKGIAPLPGKRHYFKGSDPDHWLTNIPTFEKVQYKETYPGIDLIYYDNNGQLEYDFIVAPYANPNDIRLQFSGADEIKIDKHGNLLMHTLLGDVIHHAPFAYQITDHHKQQIDAEYQITDGHLSFHLAAYDTENTVVIDPRITYSSYNGGADNEKANAIAVDNNGNFYITGSISSNSGIGADVFVAKYNAAGQLLFNAVIGSDGLREESGNDITLDGLGNIYITGHASQKISLEFPNFKGCNPDNPASCSQTTPGAYQEASIVDTPVDIDAFVTKLNNDGDMILYSTFIGGSNDDKGNGIAVDNLGMIYVTGTTFSDHDDTRPFPTAPVQSFSGDTNPNFSDAFVIKLNPALNGASDLLFSNYLGGNDNDTGRDIAVGNAGVYITGKTYSSNNFPKIDPYQANLRGVADAFIAKFNKATGTLEFSSYLGGDDNDGGEAIAIGSDGSIYVAGDSNTIDTLPPHGNFPGIGQQAFDPHGDAFISKLHNTGASLIYSTYLGGYTGVDRAYDIAVDSPGNAYITGSTGVTGEEVFNNFPVKDYQSIQAGFGGKTDAFITKLDSLGTLSFASFLGGASEDEGHGIALDKNGVIYVTGWTTGGIPLTTTGEEVLYGGGTSDAFVTRIGPLVDLELLIDDQGDGPELAQGGTLIYSFTITNKGPDTATGIVLSNTLPATGVTLGPVDTRCTGTSTITCNLGSLTLAPGASTTLSISVIVNTNNVISNTASVTATEADYPPENNSGEAISQVGTGATNPPVINNQTDFIIPAQLSTSSTAGSQGNIGAGSGGGALSPLILLFLFIRLCRKQALFI